MAGGLITLPTRHPAGTVGESGKGIPYETTRGLPFGHPPFFAFLALAASLAGLFDAPASLTICEYHSRTAGGWVQFLLPGKHHKAIRKQSAESNLLSVCPFGLYAFCMLSEHRLEKSAKDGKRTKAQVLKPVKKAFYE